VYNDYEVLASLEKALGMDYPDYFVIVVDDSSDTMLSLELAKLSLQMPGKLVHLRRPGREGLKAGALNDAARLAADLGAKYMLVLDADFEPPSWLLKAMVSVAEEYDADVVQGHQKHSKGAVGVFGRLYRAGMAGAIIFMAGRRHLDMFPIFTGSVGLLRVEAVLSTPFTEGSISEDLRWTIDRVADVGSNVVLPVHHVYAEGSVPRNLRAFYRQQLRWSGGTLTEFLRTFHDFFFDSRLTLAMRAGFLLQGLFYTQGFWVYVNTITPIAYLLLKGVSLSALWPLGLYIWLIGIETIILAGSLEEGYRRRELLQVALTLIPFVYLTAAIHLIGTMRVLAGRGGAWVVTPKRGVYQHLYQGGSDSEGA